MRKIDYICIFLCTLAAALCYIGNPFSAPVFCISSVIGLIDSIKGKAICPALINGIFLTLNLAFTIKNFFMGG